MKTIGENRDRAGKISERDLGDRDEQIEDEDAAENADDGPVAISRPRQNTCAVGIGHHRSWTFPMMYFFGTKPQWRLSELLLR